MLAVAKFLSHCTSHVPGCHLEQPLSKVAWETAVAKAKELDISKGDVPGLYPAKWQVRQDSLEIVIFYFYDYPESTRVGFFAYLEGTKKVHIGVFDTEDKMYQCIAQPELFSLNVTFRAELLGVVNATYKVSLE